jgi:hypothetical protein
MGRLTLCGPQGAEVEFIRKLDIGLVPVVAGRINFTGDEKIRVVLCCRLVSTIMADG